MKYLIVGGGMTASAAVQGIRELDQNESILMISADENPPYNRPPLSKALWKGKPLESIWRAIPEDNSVKIILRRKIVKIDPLQKKALDDQGKEYAFNKILLASGGSPRRLPFGGDDIIYYRSLEDYQKLRQLAEAKKTFAVIGSGFIGSEIAAALSMNGKEIMLFDIGPGIGWNIYPPELVAFLNRYYSEKNVQVLPNQRITGIDKQKDEYRIRTSDGKTYTCDAVVAGIGINPNTRLAEDAGLKVEDGIVVDKMLQSSTRDILTAGDVANFINPLLGKRQRVEHADNANAMGRQAGRNMAGANEPYLYLPFFYSDMFDLGYEAVGELNANLRVVEDWQEKYLKGVIYYLHESRVKGVLLWNVWGRVEEAREIIGASGPVKEKDLIGRIT